MKKEFLMIIALISVQTLFAQNTPWSTTDNIGIGTTTPISPLQVNSTTVNPMRVYSTARGSNGGSFLIMGNYWNGTTTANGDRLGGVSFSGTVGSSGVASSASMIGFAEGGFSSSSIPGSLRFYTTAVNSITLAERMRVTPEGYVGIGTTTPVNFLHVQGNATQAVFVNTAAPGGGSGAAMSGYINATPTASGQRLGSFILGSRGGGAQLYNSIGLLGWAEGAWTAGTSHPSYLTLETTPSGSTARAERMRITANGNVGIGLLNPNYKLAVEGTIAARKVKVTQEVWADYVFAPHYKLLSLDEVEKYIKANKHLPDVPSEAEVTKHGLDLGDNQAVLLKKIEELTLYVIEQNKKLEEQQKEIVELKKKVEKAIVGHSL